jgi:polyisoprenoid-binding protein YceI
VEEKVKAKLFAMTLVAAPLLGFAAMKTLEMQPSSTLWVEGTSTVRSFKCTATKLDAALIGDAEAPIAALVNSATITVPVAQLDCANGKMNEHMRKALKADANPQIEFKLGSYDVNGANATLKGELTMAGVTKPIEIPATVTDQDESVRVQASKVLNMKEWDIKPPSLMLGAMKVGQNVTVKFDVTVKR